jgi:hypothetical protein
LLRATITVTSDTPHIETLRAFKRYHFLALWAPPVLLT